MRFVITLMLLAVMILTVGGCASSSSPPASTTTPASTSSSAQSAGGTTFGQAGDAGKTVFAGSCVRCHGNNGQGTTAPAVIGSSANLGKYNTAQGLLDFIRVSMPFNAPGSLSSQDYLNVLSFLLVQNNYVSSGTALDTGQLKNIQLKK
jgi:polar amino acid transport system substrate-binding protein